MRVDLTIESTMAPSCDVAVFGTPDTRMDEIAGQLRDIAGGAPDAAIWSDGSVIDAGVRLGSDRLAVGSVLHVGPRAPRGRARASMLTLRVVGGPDSGRAIALPIGSITIGRSALCDLVLTDADVSRRHAFITVSHDAVTVTDLGATNCSTVDGVVVAPSGAPLRAGQVLRLGDSFLALSWPVDAPARVRPIRQQVMIRRHKRLPERLDNREYEVPGIEEGAQRSSATFAPTALALAIGVAMAVMLHSAQMLFLAAAMPLTTAGMTLVEALRRRRSTRRSEADRRQRTTEIEMAIAQAMSAEANRRRQSAPDAASVAEIAVGRTNRIWERAPRDSGTLPIRVGTGDLPSQLHITQGGVPVERTVSSVPVEVDLARGAVIVTGPRTAMQRLAGYVLCQLAVLYSPVDVEIVGMFSPDVAHRWHWLRWLPHLRQPPSTSTSAWADTTERLSRVAARRRAARPAGEQWSGRWVIVFVDVPAGTVDAALLDVFAQPAAEIGITAVVVGAQSLSPRSSSLSIHGETGTRLAVSRAGARIDCVADQMHPEASEVVARALAPLLDHAATQRAEVPHLCRLLDLLQLAPHPSGRDLAERWQHSDGRPTTVLGLSNSGPVEIDLAADGPHLLIAGTTGAGKSELLQSLVVGLAANHPPESVSFVLIDYKGGAAFAECAPLPHVAGMVTDLDPSLTDRALQAFECELRRRERLFVPVGAADLNAYRATPGVPHLPRLIIVIDEFAALAEDAPELLHGLVSVAQRGRSLGIQLVLATQRPAGIVSADIRANTSLRIALRVNDTSESIDVIGTGDAATIDPTHAGRAIMVRAGARTGIQIAQVSGQVARDPLRTGVVRLMPWRELPDDTQPGADATGVPDRDIRVLVRAIGAAAAITQRPPAPCPWLPPLPDVIADADLPAPPRTDVVHFGLVDQPRDQAQAAALVDLGTGGTIVFAGAARTGRTTGARCLALRAAAQLTAAQLRVYAVGSGVTDLAGLPHCVEAVDLLAFETVATLLRRMSVDLQRRRDPRAQIELLIIDGWEEFAAASDQADHGCSTDIALDIARRAGSARLTVVITGDRAALGARVTSTAMVTYALRLSDRADYGLIGIDPRRVPAHMPAGRALRAPGGEQVQFAQPSGINPCGGTGDRSAVRTSP